jgi:hypothetical protein
VRPPRGATPLVVHVADPDGAELTIHQDERTRVIRDRDLVLRLLHAAANEG